MKEFFSNLSVAPSVKSSYYDTTMLEAMWKAISDVDRFQIPQTIFHNEDTSGWTNTNPFASVLSESSLWVTILPARFFN